jgi:hypothetical protein
MEAWFLEPLVPRPGRQPIGLVAVRTRPARRNVPAADPDLRVTSLMRTGHRLNGAGPGSLCGFAVPQVEADTLRKPRVVGGRPARPANGKENENEESEASGEGGLSDATVERGVCGRRCRHVAH